MYISKFQVENYKSFFSSQEIDLTPGFNVIIGQNNVGKTALLKALSLCFQHKPHRSKKTIPRPGMPSSPDSQVNVAFQLAEYEAEQLLVNSRANFFVPLPSSIKLNQEDVAKFASEFREILVNGGLLWCIYKPSTFISAYLEAYGSHTANQYTMQFTIDFSRGQIEPVLDGSYPVANGISQYQYGITLAKALRERIYIFKAERLNISISRFGPESVLKPDASNLPEVLHNMQNSNPIRFRRFNDYVSIIFPEIKYITIPPAPSDGQIQILVWSIDPATERDDLAIPLSESGTGIGQVLAILYVVLTAQYSQTIIIDEPQSFLHPGAVRKLMEILTQHSQHQFIITTHSPEIISMTNPKTLLLLRKEEAETIIKPLDSSEARPQQLCLSEVGVRLADVFGADNILWVEGATEELCFPLIIEKMLHKPLQGTKILGIVHTGDFESKHSELVFQIYDRLSKGSGLIPPALGFIFDREGRTPQNQDDLRKRSKDKIVFLNRRMYENYLLNPDAISAIVSKIEGFRENPVTAKEIQQWLECNCLDKQYYNSRISKTPDISVDKWLQNVHGAKLLTDIFKYFSENRVEYDKVTYGIALTEWILENAPEDLAEVAKIINSMLRV